MILLRRLLFVSLATLLVAPAGCGKKGPPLAPLRLAPAPVEKLTARRIGDAAHLEFTVPTANQDGSRPADVARIEVYGLTLDPGGRSPDEREFLAQATRVATFEIRPPPPPDEETNAAEREKTPAPADTRPVQGSVVSIDEVLSDELRVPVRFESKQPGRSDTTATAAVPFDPPGSAAGPARTYLVRAFSRKNRASAPSARVEVALGPSPRTPTGLTLTYSEAALTLAWDPEAPDPWRPLWPILGYAQGFNVYEMPVDPAAVPSVQPLNPALHAESTFEVPLSAFGVTRCFAVRAVSGFRNRLAEGASTMPVCVTPVDTFAPASPTGLAAVAEAGAISLIWNAVAAPDVAGYLVLRGEAPGETLQAITPSPIRETTWRDATVRPGVRYVYAVVAIDGATPPNPSAPSARVEETAR